MGPLKDMKSSIKALRRQNYENKSYISPSALDELVTEGAILRILSESNVGKKGSHTDIAEEILKSGKKVFAILVLMEKPELIVNFIKDDGFRHAIDSNLPFVEQLPKPTMTDPEVIERSLDSRLARILGVAHLRQFEKKQWEFTAPVFGRGILSRALHEFTVLPFPWQGIRKGSGSFGVVYPIIIDPAHRSFDGHTNSKASLKLL
jgi:hypothetical protein